MKSSSRVDVHVSKATLTPALSLLSDTLESLGSTKGQESEGSSVLRLSWEEVGRGSDDTFDASDQTKLFQLLSERSRGIELV